MKTSNKPSSTSTFSDDDNWDMDMSFSPSKIDALEIKTLKQLAEKNQMEESMKCSISDTQLIRTLEVAENIHYASTSAPPNMESFKPIMESPLLEEIMKELPEDFFMDNEVWNSPPKESPTHPRSDASVLRKLLTEAKVGTPQKDDVTALKSAKTCPTCNKSFARNSELNRHLKTHSGEKSFACEICSKSFTRKSILMNHLKVHQKVSCTECNEQFDLKKDLALHKRTTHQTSAKRKSDDIIAPQAKKSRKQKSFDALNVFSIVTFDSSEDNEHDFNIFFEHMTPLLEEEIQYQVLEKRAIKWYLVTHVILNRITQEGDSESITANFRSKVMIELADFTISSNLKQAYAKIIRSFEAFTQMGSGWILEKIEKIELCMAKFHPLAASSYIELPLGIGAKHAVLNIKNEDQKCLVWCILAHKYQIPFNQHANRVSKYEPYEHEVQLGNIQCPVPLNKISKIEELNDLRINVFGYEEEVFPLYISEREDEDCINLLLISKEDNYHYTLIRSFSRLLGDLTNYQHKSHYCYRCLHRFCREDLLKQHTPLCKKQAPQKIKMPEHGDHILQFENYQYCHPVPYVIYADFESLIVGMDQVHTTINIPKKRTRKNKKMVPKTKKIAHHEACGYAYHIIGPNGKRTKPISVYRGPNAVQEFLKAIIKEEKELAKILTTIVPIKMTPQDNEDFQSATVCYLCKKPLNGDRIRDHDHLDGRYRGALHNSCNLKFRLQKKIPVVFHNLKHYDGHLLMQQLGNIDDHSFSVIPSTMEKYISFH